MSQRSFHFITLFPETIELWLKSSILGRAHNAGIFEFETIQLRDFAKDNYRSVDDTAYGGGGGMVLSLEPLVAAVESLTSRLGREHCLTIYFSPAGRPLNQHLVEELSAVSPKKHFIFICGHYEGIDQRFVDHWVDMEISLGDFVLTGGELPALATADALIRQLDGTLARLEAPQSESFALKQGENRLLEYPHYTRPAEFRGHKVPEILLSGDHERIKEWRQQEAQRRTKSKRPDLLPPNLTEGPI